MEHNIKELDINALQREILRRCGRRTEFSAVRDKEDDKCQEEKDIQELDVFCGTEVDEIAKEELQFEEILALKRRKYTAKEEFIYLSYNDILSSFVTEWDGYYLRKKPLVREADVEIDEIDKDKETDELDERDVSLVQEEEEGEDEARVSSWKKLSLPDEFANILFYNGNFYSGRISRKMMEGEGEYKWRDGVQYKGQFEQNQIQGRGLLKWNSSCWYEGDFTEGLLHGKGVIVDKERNRVYVSQWRMGKRIRDIRGTESLKYKYLSSSSD